MAAPQESLSRRWLLSIDSEFALRVLSEMGHLHMQDVACPGALEHEAAPHVLSSLEPTSGGYPQVTVPADVAKPFFKDLKMPAKQLKVLAYNLAFLAYKGEDEYRLLGQPAGCHPGCKWEVHHVCRNRQCVAEEHLARVCSEVNRNEHCSYEQHLPCKIVESQGDYFHWICKDQGLHNPPCQDKD